MRLPRCWLEDGGRTRDESCIQIIFPGTLHCVVNVVVRLGGVLENLDSVPASGS